MVTRGASDAFSQVLYLKNTRHALTLPRLETAKLR